MEKTFTPQQSYKNRAEAFRLFIQAQGLPIGQTKFYSDCESFRLIKQDKSLELSALMAYVREELNVQPSTGLSLVEQDRLKRLDELELREKELKIEKLEREARKDDKDWIHRDTVYEREGAIVGALLTESVFRSGRSVAEVITVCGGDQARAPEVKALLKRIIYQSFQSLYDSGEIDIAFEGDEEQ